MKKKLNVYPMPGDIGWLLEQASDHISDGDTVVWTEKQAKGAIPNGTRVVKCGSKPGDTHQDGAPATVLGSVGPVDGVYGYFVEFDDAPGRPTAVVTGRIREVGNGEGNKR